MKNKTVSLLLASAVLAGVLSGTACQDKKENPQNDLLVSSTDIDDPEHQKDDGDFLLDCGFEVVFKNDGSIKTEEDKEALTDYIKLSLSSQGFDNTEVTIDDKTMEIKVKSVTKKWVDSYDHDEFVSYANEALYHLKKEPTQITFRGGYDSDPSGLPVVLEESDIKKAYSSNETNSQGVEEYVVILELNDEGKEKLAKATEEYLNRQISIWADDECISAPMVDAVITDGIARISGDFTSQSAAKLASTINLTGTLTQNIFVLFSNEKSCNIIAPSNEERDALIKKIPWAFKAGDVGLKYGTWVYCTFEAANEAYNKITENDISDSEIKFEDVSFKTAMIDGKTGEEWITDEAKKKALRYLTLITLAAEKNLALDVSRYEDYSSFYSQYYDYYNSYYNNLFIELGTSPKSYTDYNIYLSGYTNELFKKLYDKGGKYEVTDDEIVKFFKDNYCSYSYFSIDLSEKENKDEYVKRFGEYAEMINSGGKTRNDVLNQYLHDFEIGYDPFNDYDRTLSDLSEDKLGEYVIGMKDKTALAKEIDGSLYLIIKNDISERAEHINTLEDDEEDPVDRYSVLYEMKNDDLEKYIQNAVDGLVYETNQDVLDKYSAERTIEIMKKCF